MAALGLLYFLVTSSPLSYSLYFISLHNCHACACSNFFHALEPTNPWRQVMIYAVIASRQISLPGLQPRCLRPSHLVLCNTSHVGNASLPFSCVLQFTSDSASLVLSFALDVPFCTHFPSHPHQLYTHTSSPMSTQSPPLSRKSTTGTSQGTHSSFLYHL